MNIYFYAQTICFRTVLPGIHLGRKIPVVRGKETVEKIRLTRTFRTVQKPYFSIAQTLYSLFICGLFNDAINSSEYTASKN